MRLGFMAVYKQIQSCTVRLPLIVNGNWTIQCKFNQFVWLNSPNNRDVSNLAIIEAINIYYRSFGDMSRLRLSLGLMPPGSSTAGKITATNSSWFRSLCGKTHACLKYKGSLCLTITYFVNMKNKESQKVTLLSIRSWQDFDQYLRYFLWCCVGFLLMHWSCFPVYTLFSQLYQNIAYVTVE